MNKILFSAFLSSVAALSINAAVVATVNGESISDNDIASFMSQAAPGYDVSKMPAEVKKRVAEDIINKKLLLEDAKKSGIEKSSEFKKIMEAAGDNIAGELYFKKIFDTIKVGDADIENFYKENKDKFVRAASVKAKHILVKTEKEAKDIISKLKGLKGNKLADKFSEFAKKESIDKGSAVNGGELGWFGKSQMVKPFADAAFSLSKGSISKSPVKSNFGYHIILKEDSKPAGTVDLKEVKEQIEGTLKKQKFQEVIKQKVDALRSKAKIQYK